MCAEGKRNTWYFSLGGEVGTQRAVRHRSRHVHVICSKRPTCRCRTVGAPTGVYGAKPAVTRSRLGSTQRVSATTASFACSVSPKRCTVGTMLAYAFSGSPSPRTEPDGWYGSPGCGEMIGLAADAAPARTSAPASAAGVVLMRSLRATSGE